MTPGRFVDFMLPYLAHGAGVPPGDQAESILEEARRWLERGAPGVGITYSANYDQTRVIARVYLAGGWRTRIAGSNQAAVMMALEALQAESAYHALQHKVHILPITTMNAYPGADPVSPWSDDVHLGLVIADLERIRAYLEAGWVVLGWQNQETVRHPERPYAVGGGVATVAPPIVERIQRTLAAFAERYAQ